MNLREGWEEERRQVQRVRCLLGAERGGAVCESCKLEVCDFLGVNPARREVPPHIKVSLVRGLKFCALRSRVLKRK
jgi:hypothetical protein